MQIISWDFSKLYMKHALQVKPELASSLFRSYRCLQLSKLIRSLFRVYWQFSIKTERITYADFKCKQQRVILEWQNFCSFTTILLVISFSVFIILPINRLRHKFLMNTLLALKLGFSSHSEKVDMLSIPRGSSVYWSPNWSFLSETS